VTLSILFEDDQLIAIHKPHGLLVHRTRMAKDATEFAVQLLRDQIGGDHVYPVHRLDRKTSGVLLFAKTQIANQEVQGLFRERLVSKIYTAIARGFVDQSASIDYPLLYNEKRQEAQTDYELISHYEIDLPCGNFNTSRYSHLLLKPKTGRFHQLRKHMSHINHPILGDRPHGCNKQNKLWKDTFNMTTMMLHAQTLQFEYPKGNQLTIHAEVDKEFERALQILKDRKLGRVVSNGS